MQTQADFLGKPCFRWNHKQEAARVLLNTTVHES
jgi:hypothetical protein